MTGRQLGPSPEQRASALEEVRYAEETSTDRSHRRGFQAWCAANAVSEFPTDEVSGERLLLRFLHSTAMARDWSWGTCCAAAAAVAKHQMRAGHSDPRGTLVAGWLAARKRETGKRTTRPVDALTRAEVHSALTTPDVTGAAVVAWRAALALMACLEDSHGIAVAAPTKQYGKLAVLPRSSFEVREHEIRVRADDGVCIVVKARTPHLYELLATALATGVDTPLSQGYEGRPRARWAAVRAFRARFRRAVEASMGRPGRISEAQADAWWAAADRERRVQVMHLMDDMLLHRTQAEALLLFGLAGLFRNAELVRFNIGHVVADADGSGYSYRLDDHKGARLARGRGNKGEPLVGRLEHGAGGECPAICGACALGRHLLARAWCGAEATDPLFVNLAHGSFPRLRSRDHTKRVVTEVATHTHLDDGTERRVNTRSLRVSGATWLREAGLSYAELQEVGGWTSADHARLYVRRYDPWASGHLVLGLKAPGPFGHTTEDRQLTGSGSPRSAGS